LPRQNKLANHRGDHPVGQTGGKLVRPLADRRTRAPDAGADSVGVGTEQSESSRFLHGADDLTTTKARKQTAGHAPKQPARSSTSADVRRRPLASTDRVIDRLDKAMKVVGASGVQLAAAIGIKPQSLTNLRRKPKGGMRAELLAHAADFLRCDLRWLCTGEGGDYVPASDVRVDRLAREVAEVMTAMNHSDRWKAYGMFNLMRRGYWPVFEEEPPLPARSGR
jgi:hypothetical protein